MLYIGEHLRCWAASVIVALIYALAPCNKLIWPLFSIFHHIWGLFHYSSDSIYAARTTTVADELPENNTITIKTNAKKIMKAVLDILYSNEFNHPYGPMRAAAVTLAMGPFAQYLSVYGPLGTRHWLHVAFLHALLAFSTIGLVINKFRVVSNSSKKGKEAKLIISTPSLPYFGLLRARRV
jgi:hypothetical protein